MPNVVTILVTAKDTTGSAIKSASSGFGSLAAMAAEAGVAVGIALAGMAAKAVSMAATFDSEMEKLHTQAGVAQSSIAGLSQGVLKLAGQVGQSPDSLAQALFHVESNFASLGISSQKAMSLVKIAAEGASVGGANLVDVTNALTAAVASGIPGVDDFSKAMGILNATVGAGDMTMQDLSNALSSGVLAVVKGYGLSIRDVSAALATFGDNNIRGKVAATDLRTAVQALAVPAKDGKAQLIAWGVSANQLATDMQQHGLLFALEHLQQLFKQNGVTATQQGQIITDMFGKKAGSGLAILMGQMDRLKSKYPDLDKGASQFGDAWTHTQATLKQVWAEIKAGFDAWMISMGEKLTPIIEKTIPLLKQGWREFQTVVRSLSKDLNFAGSFKEIRDQGKAFIDEFKKDWPQLKPLVMLVVVAVGLLAKGLLEMAAATLWVDKVMTEWLSGMAGLWVGMAKGALAALKFLADGAGLALQWIPGIGPMVRKAKDDIDKFVDGANAALDHLVNPTIHVNVVVHGGKGLPYANKPMPGMAHGGIVGAASGGPRSNLTLVGENGPELVDIPGGSRVMSNADSRSMMSRGPQSGGQLEMRIVGNIDGMFVTYLKQLLRTNQISLYDSLGKRVKLV